MNTTAPLIKPPPPPSASYQASPTTSTRAAQSETSTVGDLLVDLPLIGIIPFGLPSVILLGGWTLLALSLAAPFVLLLLIAFATVIIVALTAAIVAPLYLIARRLHRYRLREVHPVGDNSTTKRRGGGLITRPAAPLPAAAHLAAAAPLDTGSYPRHLGVNGVESAR